ncbi:O-methyltransferase [Nocardia salmonicida]
MRSLPGLRILVQRRTIRALGAAQEGDSAMAQSSTRPTSGGPAYGVIDEILGRFGEYRNFRAGDLGRGPYSDWVESRFDELLALGLNRDKQNLSTRFPHDDHACVQEILGELAETGIVSGAEYPAEEFERYAARVATEFDHAGRITFIFPEESRLMFALAHQLRPRHAVFLGSYYGYWATWALPAIAESGGRVTLVDIDPDVMALAERNIAALGFGSLVEFVVADAAACAGTLRDVDLCVIDAEGPLNAADPDQRGKAIYYPHTCAVGPALTDGALLVAHNVLLTNLTENRYFAGRIADNETQFTKWSGHLADNYGVHRRFATSEGIGIYRRGDVLCAG